MTAGTLYRAPRVARGALVLMAAGAAFVAILAMIAPRWFYDSFPFVASWVEKLPPYNEHLVTDVGGLYLALAVIAVWAASTMSLQLVRALSVGWLVAAALHFAFHANHLGDYSGFDAIAQMVSLAAYVLLPLAALWGTMPAGPRPFGTGGKDSSDSGTSGAGANAGREGGGTR